jgi:hypothetical protein
MQAMQAAALQTSHRMFLVQILLSFKTFMLLQMHSMALL